MRLSLRGSARVRPRPYETPTICHLVSSIMPEQNQMLVIPNPRERASEFISWRVGVRDLVLCHHETSTRSLRPTHALKTARVRLTDVGMTLIVDGDSSPHL